MIPKLKLIEGLGKLLRKWHKLSLKRYSIYLIHKNKMLVSMSLRDKSI